MKRWKCKKASLSEWIAIQQQPFNKNNSSDKKYAAIKGFSHFIISVGIKRATSL